MAAIKPSMKEILCLEKIKYWKYHMKCRLLSWFITRTRNRGGLFLGENWTQGCNRIMLKDKYAVRIYQEGKKKVIGHLSLGKSGKFANTIFYFLKAANENRCQIIIHAKASCQSE